MIKTDIPIDYCRVLEVIRVFNALGIYPFSRLVYEAIKGETNKETKPIWNENVFGSKTSTCKKRVSLIISYLDKNGLLKKIYSDIDRTYACAITNAGYALLVEYKKGHRNFLKIRIESKPKHKSLLLEPNLYLDK